MENSMEYRNPTFTPGRCCTHSLRLCVPVEQLSLASINCPVTRHEHSCPYIEWSAHIHLKRHLREYRNGWHSYRHLARRDPYLVGPEVLHWRYLDDRR